MKEKQITEQPMTTTHNKRFKMYLSLLFDHNKRNKTNEKSNKMKRKLKKQNNRKQKAENKKYYVTKTKTKQKNENKMKLNKFNQLYLWVA